MMPVCSINAFHIKTESKQKQKRTGFLKHTAALHSGHADSAIDTNGLAVQKAVEQDGKAQLGKLLTN